MRNRGLVVVLVACSLVVLAAVFAIVQVVRSSLAPTDTDYNFGQVSVYAVQSDATLDPVPSGLTAHVWDAFVRVVGGDYAAETIDTYRVGNDADSDTLAYVVQNDDDLTRWALAANLAHSDDDATLIPTLVHEYAHLLSLSIDQLTPKALGCETLTLAEGCARPDSLLFAFQEQFWAHYGDAAPQPGEVRPALGFFQQHKEDFVSDYAATNVTEDFAESFMTFVLEPEPDDDSTMIARKLLFFWQVPEYVQIRDGIRAEFSF